MREKSVERKTAETDIALRLSLDGSGKGTIDTGVGFMDHMLTLLSKHARFDLDISCKGDVYVDDHHSTEDIGICLGTAFKAALGEARGIRRYGSMLLPMDEALVLCAADISGRACLIFDVDIPTEKVGSFDTELVKEFLLAFTRKAEITLHFKLLAGENSHHIIEACFKGLGRALREAVSGDIACAGEIPSSKGMLL